MIKLEVGKSGKTVFNKGEIDYLPAALIPYFIMLAGKTVEVKVDPGGPFYCLSESINKGKETYIFKLDKWLFRVCSDIACQALGKGKKYEIGEIYHLAVKEIKKAMKPKKEKAKSKRGKK